MPESIRLFYLYDGLELVVSEGKAGVELKSYRVRVRGRGAHAVVSDSIPPGPSTLGKRFPTVDELITSLRRDL